MFHRSNLENNCTQNLVLQFHICHRDDKDWDDICLELKKKRFRCVRTYLDFQILHSVSKKYELKNNCRRISQILKSPRNSLWFIWAKLFSIWWRRHDIMRWRRHGVMWWRHDVMWWRHWKKDKYLHMFYPHAQVHMYKWIPCRFRNTFRDLNMGLDDILTELE